MPTTTGVVPSRQEEEITKNDVCLFKLKRIFEKKESDLDWIPATEEETIMIARYYILHLLGEYLFSITNKNNVVLEYLPLVDDLHQTTQYNWALAVLSYLYSKLFKVVANRRLMSYVVLSYYNCILIYRINFFYIHNSIGTFF